MIFPSSGLLKRLIDSYINEISRNGSSFDEISDLVGNLALLLDDKEYCPGAVYDFFTLDQIRVIAYYFYCYDSFIFYDNYDLLDKFFRSLDFDSYVYVEKKYD